MKKNSGATTPYVYAFSNPPCVCSRPATQASAFAVEWALESCSPSGHSRRMILDVADWRDLERKLAVVKAEPDECLRRLAFQLWAAEWGCKDLKPGADFQGVSWVLHFEQVPTDLIVNHIYGIGTIFLRIAKKMRGCAAAWWPPRSSIQRARARRACQDQPQPPQ